MRPSDEQLGHVGTSSMVWISGGCLLTHCALSVAISFRCASPLGPAPAIFRVIGFGDFHDFFQNKRGAGGNDAVVAKTSRQRT